MNGYARPKLKTLGSYLNILLNIEPKISRWAHLHRSTVVRGEARSLHSSFVENPGVHAGRPAEWLA